MYTLLLFRYPRFCFLQRQLGPGAHLNPFISHLFLAFLKPFYWTPEGLLLSIREEEHSKTYRMHRDFAGRQGG